MILSSPEACGGASLASPVKYAAASLKNWLPCACRKAILRSAAGILGMFLPMLVKSVQKWPVSLGAGKPATADPLPLPVELLLADAAALLVLPAAVLTGPTGYGLPQ